MNNIIIIVDWVLRLGQWESETHVILAYRGRIDQGRINQGRIDRDRIDPGRIDQIRLDRGRIDRGRIDQGRIDPGRIDQIRIDRGRLDQGRLDRGRIDQGRIDQIRIDRGRINQGRIDQIKINIWLDRSGSGRSESDWSDSNRSGSDGLVSIESIRVGSISDIRNGVTRINTTFLDRSGSDRLAVVRNAE